MRPPSKIHSECSSHEALPVKIFSPHTHPTRPPPACLKSITICARRIESDAPESQAQHLSSRSSAFKPYFSKSPRSLATYIEVGCCPLPHCCADGVAAQER